MTACSPPAQLGIGLPKLTETGKPVLHAIDSDELRQLMRRMNNLMNERNLTDQEMDDQRRHAVSQVLIATKGIDQAIAAILAAMPNLNLDPGEQKVFRSLAVNLRGETEKLQFQADAQQLDIMPATLERMSATCTSCHQLFRDFSKSGVQK